jgi:hypothetical protein
MAHHLAKCPQRQTSKEETGNGQKEKFFQISVQGRYAPEYWMHLEVAADAKLKDLDSFLRDIWLECCGHLSGFVIGERNYVSSMVDAAYGDKTMDVKIGSVLRLGTNFIHEYDYGTTTTLALRVVSERKGEPKDEQIEIMARNEPPKIACSVCGKPATQVCSNCIYDGKGWLCDKCAKSHKCEEEMLLPVVNSPRVGMCAYAGGYE